MTTISNIHRTNLDFPILFTLTVILCLATIQTIGVDSSIPIATAASSLVFCSRRRVFTTWEILEQAYLLQTSPPKG